MPLDSTQIKLQELERARLFSRGTALTDALTILYHQWAYGTKQETPTMFDAVAVGYAIRPELCPMKKMRLAVEEDGSTKPVEGEAERERVFGVGQRCVFEVLYGESGGGG